VQIGVPRCSFWIVRLAFGIDRRTFWIDRRTFRIVCCSMRQENARRSIANESNSIASFALSNQKGTFWIDRAQLRHEIGRERIDREPF
jgi:hypothetical protein